MRKKAGIVGAAGVYGRMAAGAAISERRTGNGNEPEPARGRKIQLIKHGAADERSKQDSGRY